MNFQQRCCWSTAHSPLCFAATSCSIFALFNFFLSGPLELPLIRPATQPPTSPYRRRHLTLSLCKLNCGELLFLFLFRFGPSSFVFCFSVCLPSTTNAPPPPITRTFAVIYVYVYLFPHYFHLPPVAAFVVQVYNS